MRQLFYTHTLELRKIVRNLRRSIKIYVKKSDPYDIEANLVMRSSNVDYGNGVPAAYALGN